MKRLIVIAAVYIIAIFGMAYLNAEAAFPIEGRLIVTISEDRTNLEIVYEIKNLTGSMIPPNRADTFHVTIRNVATGVEVFNGNLDSAFQTNVSQYASPYAHAIFAVKRILIPAYMTSMPGFYLAFQSAQYNALGEETVFYVPANLTNPNPIIRQINSTVNAIVTKVNAIAAKLGL